MEHQVIWKSPVDLSEIRIVDAAGKDKINPMENELKFLAAWNCIGLRGPPGIGKTYSPMQWAKKNGYEVFIQECSSDMSIFDLYGTYMLNPEGGGMYAAGVVASAIKYSQEGKKVMLILDEVNLLPQNVQKELGSISDFRASIETPEGRIYTKGNLLIVGTMNSEQESAGFDLDPTLVSRWMLFTLDPKEYSQRLIMAGVVDESAGEIIGETNGKFGIRECLQVTAIVTKMNMPLQEAIKMVVDKFPHEEDRKQIRQVLAMKFSPTDARRMGVG